MKIRYYPVGSVTRTTTRNKAGIEITHERVSPDKLPVIMEVYEGGWKSFTIPQCAYDRYVECVGTKFCYIHQNRGYYCKKHKQQPRPV